MNKRRQIIIGMINGLFLFIATGVLLGTSGGPKTNVAKAPEEPPSLEKGNPSLQATIIDHNKTYDVIDIAFSGSTKLGKVRKLSDRLWTTVVLENIRGLKIINNSYAHTEEGETDQKVNLYVLAERLNKTGENEADLLIPHDVVISALDAKTRNPLWWYLRDIKEIQIHGPAIPHKRRK